MVLLLPVCLPGSPSASSALVNASAGAEGKMEEWDPCLCHQPASGLINCNAGPHSERGVYFSLCVGKTSQTAESASARSLAEWEQPRGEYVLKETLCLNCCLPLGWHPCPQGTGRWQTSGASVLISLSCHLGILGWRCQFAGSAFLAHGCFLPSPLCCQSCPEVRCRISPVGSVVCR